MTHAPSNESLGIGCLVALALMLVGFVVGLAVGTLATWILAR